MPRKSDDVRVFPLIGSITPNPHKSAPPKQMPPDFQSAETTLGAFTSWLFCFQGKSYKLPRTSNSSQPSNLPLRENAPLPTSAQRRGGQREITGTRGNRCCPETRVFVDDVQGGSRPQGFQTIPSGSSVDRTSESSASPFGNRLLLQLLLLLSAFLQIFERL